MADNPWVKMAENIRNTFEAGMEFTMFGMGPDRVMLLPNALGGDPLQWPLLTVAAAGDRDAWLDLLWAKAHFFLLPKPIIEFVKRAPRMRVTVSEQSVEGAAADATPDEYGLGANKFRSTTMHLPGSSDYLAKFGYQLGRVPAAMTVESDLMARIYHEMTHAWIWLETLADAELQQLYTDGLAAYASAKDKDDKTLDLELAFSEAAGYYVEDRVFRWCDAIHKLDRLRRNPVDPATRDEKLAVIVTEYEKPRSLYGIVYQDSKESTIVSPELSPTLRAAIDRKILDNRPCTKVFFKDTPLQGLKDALLKP